MRRPQQCKVVPRVQRGQQMETPDKNNNNKKTWEILKIVLATIVGKEFRVCWGEAFTRCKPLLENCIYFCFCFYVFRQVNAVKCRLPPQVAQLRTGTVDIRQEGEYSNLYSNLPIEYSTSAAFQRAIALQTRYVRVATKHVLATENTEP